jgi:muconolactone delta-isomerase
MKREVDLITNKSRSAGTEKMNNYMINIKLPDKLSEDFVMLIPRQRKVVDKLMNEGKILQYSLSADRSTLWVVIAALSEKRAMDIMAKFPLIDYMNPTIYPLAFHNSVSNDLPKLIMN